MFTKSFLSLDIVSRSREEGTGRHGDDALGDLIHRFPGEGYFSGFILHEGESFWTLVDGK